MTDILKGVILTVVDCKSEALLFENDAYKLVNVNTTNFSDTILLVDSSDTDIDLLFKTLQFVLVTSPRKVNYEKFQR